MVNRFGVIALTVAVLALSACGSGSRAPGSGGNASSGPAASPQSWGASAEGVCRDLFDNRGSPETVDSQNPDDQMAADAFWAAHLQDQAATRLGGLTGQSSYGTVLISDMKYAHLLNEDMGGIYNEHTLTSNRLDQDKAYLLQVQQDIAQLSDELGTGSCLEIAKLTAPAG